MAMVRDGVFATVQPLSVRDKAGDHFTLGDGKRRALSSFDVVLLRQDPPFDLNYITTTHLLERIHPKTLVVNDPASVRNAPEKMFVTEFPDADAADAAHPRPRRDQGVPRRARRHRDEAALRPRRRRGVPADPRRPQLRFAVRHVRRDVPRGLGDPEILARGARRRQAHHSGRRRIRRRGEPRAGRRRSSLQHGARRLAEGHRADAARARDLRAPSARRCASAACCSSAST